MHAIDSRHVYQSKTLDVEEVQSRSYNFISKYEFSFKFRFTPKKKLKTFHSVRVLAQHNFDRPSFSSDKNAFIVHQNKVPQESVL